MPNRSFSYLAVLDWMDETPQIVGVYQTWYEAARQAVSAQKSYAFPIAAVWVAMPYSKWKTFVKVVSP